MSRLCLALVAIVTLCFTSRAQAQDVTVGSKKFTESYVLGEMLKKVISDAGLKVEHKQGMGATGIVWEAIKRGDISMYPEYTGTLWQEILKKSGEPSMAEMRDALKPLGIGISDPLGFNNTYSLVMSEKRAADLGIETITDLARHRDLQAGPDPEFLERKDGWRPLVATYGLQFENTRGIDHGLVYQSLQRGDIDVSDAYSTDAGIADFNLRVLKDDRNYFPAYKCIILFRLNTPEKALAAMRTLEGKIDEKTMTALNSAAEKTKDYSAAANKFFVDNPAPSTTSTTPTRLEQETIAAKIGRLTLQHLKLVLISLLLAVAIGFPLGVIASKRGTLSGIILGVTGVIQTIPGLALLAFLVPLMGIGATTAVIALVLYSLLPIVRNTATGLQEIPRGIRESAAALGLEPTAQLRKVFVPMAARTILAGIKTSAIINVGTATLAALIGAGGLGEPIISGLNLVDTSTILQGAIPAAVLAILVQVLFEGIDKMIVSKGLQ